MILFLICFIACFYAPLKKAGDAFGLGYELLSGVPECRRSGKTGSDMPIMDTICLLYTSDAADE